MKIDRTIREMRIVAFVSFFFVLFLFLIFTKILFLVSVEHKLQDKRKIVWKHTASCSRHSKELNVSLQSRGINHFRHSQNTKVGWYPRGSCLLRLLRFCFWDPQLGYLSFACIPAHVSILVLTWYKTNFQHWSRKIKPSRKNLIIIASKLRAVFMRNINKDSYSVFLMLFQARERLFLKTQFFNLILELPENFFFFRA